MGVLGSALAAQGKHAQAEVQQAAALQMSRGLLGEHHVTTRVAKHNLMMTLGKQGKQAEADALRGNVEAPHLSYTSPLVAVSA